MKYLFAFLLFFIAPHTWAQTKFPAGVANSMTLGEKEGYKNFMYLPVTIAPDGTVYSSTFNGSVEIHGNNYSVQLDSLQSLSGVINDFKIIDSSEVWAYGMKHLAVIKNKRLVKTLPLPDNIFGCIKNISTRKMYFFSANGNTAETWVFDGSNLWKTAVSDILFRVGASTVLETYDHDGYAFKTNNDSLLIYKFDTSRHIFYFKRAYKGISWIWSMKDEENFIGAVNSKNRAIGGWIKKGVLTGFYENINSGAFNSYNFYSAFPVIALYKVGESKFYTVTVDSNLTLSRNIPFICTDDINALSKNLSGHLFFGYTGNRLIALTPYIKKYPGLFNHSNTAAIFTLKEDDRGRIWAGSYKTGIAIIDKGIVGEINTNNYKMMNGGSYFNNHMYLIGEGTGGLLQYDMKGNVKPVPTSSTGFYTYVSRDKKFFYFTTNNRLGLWQTTTEKLETLQPSWNKIDSAKGNNLNNILTITEDTAGRVWLGHSRGGIAVYNPDTGRAKTWLKEKKETAFGGFASLTDAKGTVWIGGKNGLWYYSDYSRDASPQNCRQIDHPLLNTAKLITALTIYNKWLVIAAYDKILLLDLDEFYKSSTVKLRYLNPYETAFSSFTEQNTMLTAKDSTVWFSTSDMLYQWDIKNWLRLPVFTVKTNVFITAGNTEIGLKANKPVSLNPGFTSFDIHVQYVSPDNMPRYSSAALVKEGDTILLPEPGLESVYSVKSIAAGDYTFILVMFEMDGSITRYSFPVTIQKYLWQRWWFWLLLSLLVSGVLVLVQNIRRKKQVAEEKAKTKEAELNSFKSEQERKMAELRLISLSSQFRPHFILNALNTIGAQMDENPETESVLSRLGESVNLIFNHAKNQKTLHPFKNEWMLVTNIIHIHRLMYLKKLETSLPHENTIENLSQLLLPMGLLQIPVENALLHGLSNKESGPWELKIEITSVNNGIDVNITDNGIGRNKSAQLSNHTKHGTGTKNLEEIIGIINKANKDKITVSYKDGMFNQNGEPYGTIVSIHIPLNLLYEG